MTLGRLLNLPGHSIIAPTPSKGGFFLFFLGGGLGACEVGLGDKVSLCSSDRSETYDPPASASSLSVKVIGLHPPDGFLRWLED